jgi:hypothetical protein
MPRTTGGAFLPKLRQPSPPTLVTVLTGDALVDPDLTGDGVYYMTKATAAAVTLVAGSTVPLGTIVTFMAGTAVAHVVTAQSGGIFDGTTGAKTKWTSAAFIGSAITLVSLPNGGWGTRAQQLGTVA